MHALSPLRESGGAAGRNQEEQGLERAGSRRGVESGHSGPAPAPFPARPPRAELEIQPLEIFPKILEISWKYFKKKYVV